MLLLPFLRIHKRPNKGQVGWNWNAPIGKCYSSCAPKRPADDADVETAIQAAGIKDSDWIQKLL